MARKNKVLFIEASNDYIKIEKNRNDMTEEIIDKVVRVYKTGIEEEGYSSFIDISTIAQHKYNLNSEEYIYLDVLRNKMDHTILLKSIARIYRGVTVSKKHVERLGEWGAHYYINIKDIVEGEIKLDNAIRIEANVKWIEKAAIYPGDIVMSARGYDIKIAVAEKYIKDCIISDNLLIIRVDKEMYNPTILKTYLMSPLGKRLIEGLQTGASTVKLITADNLGNLPVPKISIEEMSRLAEKINYSETKYKKTIHHAEQIYNMETNEIYKKMGIENLVKEIEIENKF